MRIQAIQAELAKRLHTVFETVYLRPPAAPVFPCAIVHFPSIDTFHVDHAHSVTRMTWVVSVVAGRGDTDDAFDVLATWLSTETPGSVRDVLEAKRTDDTPWHRLALVSTGSPDVNTESIEVDITITIDA
jgi:hypothetical protein